MKTAPKDFDAIGLGTRVAVGQAVGWVRRAIGLPILGIGVVMLTIAWHAAQPHASAVWARLTAGRTASAEVVETRYLCNTAAARELAALELRHVVRGEAGCPMQEQAVLRFTDAAERVHEVQITSPVGRFVLQGLTLPYQADPFEQVVPLGTVRTYVEPGAVAPLQSVYWELPAPESIPAVEATRWTQLEVLRTRMDDPLLFTALSWIRPPPSTRVELRYRESDPEHAWLSTFVDSPNWSRVPIMVLLVLAPIGLYVVYWAAALWVFEWHRYAAAIVTALVVLATPWWSPRLFDGLEYFSEHYETVANVSEDFGDVVLDNSGRVEPRSDAGIEPLAPDPALSALQHAVLDGLIPPRPVRKYAKLGDAFEALCAAAVERFAALPAPDRTARYQAMHELLQKGVNGPAICLLPAPIKALDEAYTAGRERPMAEYNFLLADAYEPGLAGSFAHDYAAAHKLAAVEREALSREIERRREAGAD